VWLLALEHVRLARALPVGADRALAPVA
jgi:hypothetical protein